MASTDGYLLDNRQVEAGTRFGANDLALAPLISAWGRRLNEAASPQ